ncbi:MAG TPA: hypothetical protein VMM78_09070 [Thermomicrobiales bacterium]|nr:hypothetical protein [Thermomicrobiales bacterium]
MLLGIGVRGNPPDPVNVPILSSDGRLFYLLALGAVALIAVLAQRAERAREALAASRSRFVGQSIVPAPATAWILPALTVLGAALLVARHHRPIEIAAATLLAATGVFASLTVRENLPVYVDGRVNPARVAHVVLTIAIAFVVLTLVFMFRMRTLVSGPAIMIVSLLLLIQVHDGVDTWPVRKLAFGALGAVALAEITWALNYWPPVGWYAGAILTVTFTGIALVSGAQMTGTLNRERALLFASATAGLLLACTVLSW